MIGQVQSKSTVVSCLAPGRHVNVGEILVFADELRQTGVPETELVTFAYNGNHLVGIEVSHTELIETPGR